MNKLYRPMRVVKKAINLEIIETETDEGVVQTYLVNDVVDGTYMEKKRLKLGEFIIAVEQFKANTLIVSNYRLRNAIQRHVQRNKLLIKCNITSKDIK